MRDQVTETMRQLSTASFIGAVVMSFPTEPVPGIHYGQRAGVLVACAVVLLLASVLLKGGGK